MDIFEHVANVICCIFIGVKNVLNESERKINLLSTDLNTLL
jgi:hypothetical protein